MESGRRYCFFISSRDWAIAGIETKLDTTTSKTDAIAARDVIMALTVFNQLLTVIFDLRQYCFG